jgi:hypothetical protein
MTVNRRRHMFIGGRIAEDIFASLVEARFGAGRLGVFAARSQESSVHVKIVEGRRVTSSDMRLDLGVATLPPVRAQAVWNPVPAIEAHEFAAVLALGDRKRATVL